jgi:hypothetical protein
MTESEANTRVSVRKSRTVSVGSNFEKTEYGIEQDLAAQLSPDAGLRNLEAVIDSLLADNSPPVQEKYNNLPWRRSLKKAQLSTIAVTPDMPELARELYDKLKSSGKHVMRIGETTYKLSYYEETGTEFLQRWSKNQ